MTFKFTLLRSFAAVAALACGGASAAVNLPPLNIDKAQTSVSGLSSGGFMAVQLHVAYSATFKKVPASSLVVRTIARKGPSLRPRARAWPVPQAYRPALW